MAGDNVLNGEDFLELAEKFQRIAQQKGITIAFKNNNHIDKTEHK
jgi:3-deoxy-D-manno-octulosonic acid (KDO) 8-phosphate synthase